MNQNEHNSMAAAKGDPASDEDVCMSSGENYQITHEIKRGLLDHTIVILLAVLFSLSYVAYVSHSTFVDLLSWTPLKGLFQVMLYVVVLESSLFFYDVFLHNREIMGISSYFCAQSRLSICKSLVGHRPCYVSLPRMLIAVVLYITVLSASMIYSYGDHYNDRWANEYSKVLRAIISQNEFNELKDNRLFSDSDIVTVVVGNRAKLDRVLSRIQLWPTEVSEEYRSTILMLVPLIGKERIITLLGGEKAANIQFTSPPPATLFSKLFKEIGGAALLKMVHSELKNNYWKAILSNGDTAGSVNESVMKLLWMRLIEVEMNQLQSSVVSSRIKNLNIDGEEFSNLETLVIARLWMESKETEWAEFSAVDSFKWMKSDMNPMSVKNLKLICDGLQQACDERLK
jgi:hypothetical protein